VSTCKTGVVVRRRKRSRTLGPDNNTPLSHTRHKHKTLTGSREHGALAHPSPRLGNGVDVDGFEYLPERR
jgi:hypothetical protein